MNHKNCAVCFQPGGKRCSKCLTQYYCSDAHAKMFWKTHQYICNIDKESPWIVQPYLAPSEKESLKQIFMLDGTSDIRSINGKVYATWREYNNDKFLGQLTPEERVSALAAVRNVLSRKSVDHPHLGEPTTVPALSPYTQIIVDEAELAAAPETFDCNLKLAHSRPLHTQFIHELFRFETLSAIDYRDANDKYVYLDSSIERLRTLLTKIKLVRNQEDFRKYTEMVDTCDYRNVGLKRFDKGEIRRAELNEYMEAKGYNFVYAT